MLLVNRDHSSSVTVSRYLTPEDFFAIIHVFRSLTRFRSKLLSVRNFITTLCVCFDIVLLGCLLLSTAKYFCLTCYSSFQVFPRVQKPPPRLFWWIWAILALKSVDSVQVWSLWRMKIQRIQKQEHQAYSEAWRRECNALEIFYLISPSGFTQPHQSKWR